MPQATQDARIYPLPMSMRMLGTVGVLASAPTQLGWAGRLGRRVLKPERAYRSLSGSALRLDPNDPFQAAMAAGLFSRHAAWLMQRLARPGTTAIDVGAHLGYFTLLLARLVGPRGAVHAFEPDPRLYPRLVDHVELNGAGWVRTNDCGLLDRRLDDQILMISDHLGWTSIFPEAAGEARSVRVPMRTLDDYVEDLDIAPEDICFIKVDVEGAELEVLMGGQATLSQARSAAVLVEQVPQRDNVIGHQPDRISELMAGMGFEPHVPIRSRGGFVLTPGASPVVGLDVLYLRRGQLIPSGRS